MRSKDRTITPILIAFGAVGCHHTPSSATTANGWTAKDLGEGGCLAVNGKGQIVGVDDSDAAFLVTADGTRTALGTIAPDAVTIGVGIDDSGAVSGCVAVLVNEIVREKEIGSGPFLLAT